MSTWGNESMYKRLYSAETEHSITESMAMMAGDGVIVRTTFVVSNSKTSDTVISESSVFVPDVIIVDRNDEDGKCYARMIMTPEQFAELLEQEKQMKEKAA